MNESIDNGLTEATGTKTLPNSGGILAMGIMSIIFAGLIGLTLGIISLSLSGKALSLYNNHPDQYTVSSLKNVKAGKVCAIIGLSISGLAFIILILALIANA